MTKKDFRTAIAALVVIAGCSEGTAPPAPSAIAAGDSQIASGTAGVPLATAPTVVVKDASGNTLGGVPLTIEVTGGGGTLTSPPSRTRSGSPTPVGTWTLGGVVGPNSLTITVGDLVPLVITVNGVPGPVASVAAASGNAQSALAGTPVPLPLVAKVSDKFGNGVPGTAVSFAITAGGGILTAVTAMTDEAGIANGPIWQLGRSASLQTVTVVAAEAFTTTFNATVSSGYRPVVRFFGPAPPAEAAAAFNAAVERVRAMVIGDLPDILVTTSNLAGTCGLSYPQVSLNEVVDDLVIYAAVTSMDGPGGLIASAGPCILRSGGRSSVLGLMRFDGDDLPGLIARGQLSDIILHEMLHVVGLGTLWQQTNLIIDRGTSDPRFTGTLGSAACLSLGGADVCSSGIPVENTGGSGTADTHWRESVFDGELLTGFSEPQGKAMPLSAMTIQSLADIGYQVNVFAADPYNVPIPSSSNLLRSQLLVGGAQAIDEVLRPTLEVTRDGVLKPLPIQ